MFITSEDKEWLSKALGVNKEDIELFRGDNDVLEINSDYEDVEEYYFGDFRDGLTRFKDFKKKYETYCEKSNAEVKILMIFKSWEKEKELLQSELKGRNAKEKREINIFFEGARICYYDKDQIISLNLEEEGINYLEYNVSKGESTGYIYNLSLGELYKLYNKTGKDLFKDNVRVGVSNTKANYLRSNFRTIFLLGLHELNKKGLEQTLKEKTENYLKVINGSEDFSGSEVVMEHFWFHHNGVTIYSESEFDIQEDKISFDPLAVSVINGAQTLTHCFSIIREIRNDLRENIGDDEKKRDEFVQNLLEEMMSRIKIKTIFIRVDSEMKRSITLGLNTQIAVGVEDIGSNNDEVDKINGFLSRRNKKICRSGETTLNGGFYVLDFIKSYLIFKNRPGEARNLAKNKINSYLVEIGGFLEENIQNIDDFLMSVDIFQYVEKWWKKREMPQNVKKIEYDGLARNGKCYYKAYCKNMYNDAEDAGDKDKYLQEIYESFVQTFIKLNKKLNQEEINSNILKKDKLYKEYINESRNIKDDNSLEVSKDFEEKLRQIKNKYDQYKENNKSKSNRSMFLKRELENENIVLDFRTVSVTNDGGAYNLKESFPFSSKTFSQLFEVKDYPTVYDEGNNPEIIKYKDSYLKTEIDKEFCLFVFVEDLQKNLETIKLIPKLSFSELHENASTVYEKAVKAFVEGDANLFTKQSEEIHFHIRPKAKDGNDTFTFTDGSQQVKRTFWVNKKTMEDIIQEKLAK